MRWVLFLALVPVSPIVGLDPTMQPCLRPITKPDGSPAFKFHNKPNGNRRIILDDSQWPTSTINDYIAKIILEEHMGYDVAFEPSTGLSSWERIAGGWVHANLEIWPSELEKTYRARYINAERTVADLGALGVVARNGWYVPTAFAEEFPSIQSYLGLQDSQEALRHLRYTPGNYSLDPALPGLFVGPPAAWAPTRAEEQLCRNLNFSLTPHYSQDYSAYLELQLDCLLKRSNHSGRCIMYNYFPSTTMSAFNLSRVGLPEYTLECYSRAAQGGIDCDYEYFILKKIAWAGLPEYAPDAFDFLQLFTLTQSQQAGMLQNYGQEHAYDTACNWIRANPTLWQSWIPLDFTLDPPAGPSENPPWLVPLLLSLAAVAGLALLAAGLAWVLRTHQARRRFQAQLRATLEARLQDCRACLSSLSHPMHLVRADLFIACKHLTEHETLRDQELLTTLDDLQSIDDFRSTKNYIIIFLSHQWLGWMHPDPRGAQWAIMQQTVAFIAHQSRRHLEECWVWVDYCGIPQRNPSVQQLAIDSLPIYAYNSDFFIIVAPKAIHHDTREEQDLHSYNGRMWCRAEQLSRICKCGTERLYIADEVGTVPGIERLGREAWYTYLDQCVRVFSGQSACCATNHRIRGREIPCDREKLVVPMMAIFAVMRSSLNMQKSELAQIAFKDDESRHVLLQLNSLVRELFPKSHMIMTTKGKQERDLFGDLVARVCKDVQAEPKLWLAVHNRTTFRPANRIML